MQEQVIVEQSVEWRTPLYLCFFDFKKAFDTFKRDGEGAMACKRILEKINYLLK